MPPPSSGGIVLLQVLNMLDGYDIGAMQYNSAAKYHVLAEAMRRAFADRAEFMGDPDFADVPVKTLIDNAYADKRRSSIELTKASSSAEIGHGEITGKEPMETTHFTVADAQGKGLAGKQEGVGRLPVGGQLEGPVDLGVLCDGHGGVLSGSNGQL